MCESTHDILRPRQQSLEVFFAPETVAVIGATETAGAVGRIARLSGVDSAKIYDILVAGPEQKENVMKILLAVDGSTYSEAAVEAVASRPWPSGTAIRVLSVIERKLLLAAELGYDPGLDLQAALQHMTKDAEELTTRVANSLRAKGLPADVAVRVGDPREVIVNEAKEWGADLIVLGSHGYTGIERWLLGSVAQSVVSHAHCSVEVVRRPSGEEVKA